MFSFFETNPYKEFAVVKSQKNSNNQIIFEKTDISSIDFKQKSIVILCGNNSKSQSRGELYAYFCHSWLKNMYNKNNITTYSIYYPNKQPLFNENPHFTLNYDGLATEMFKKAIYKDGQILTVDEIKRNIGNVVFFGHSAGGYVMNELMISLNKILSDENFTKSQIKSIYESVVFIAYAPYELVKAPIKSVYVAPVYDTIGSTKLVYKYLLKHKNATSSMPNLDILGLNKLTERTNEKFMKRYIEKIKELHTLYFSNDNSIISTPNLLYDDGVKEDHNLAGAVQYNANNPHQTKAGKLTAKFLSDVFNYCLSTKRENFNIKDLYKQTGHITEEDTLQL